MGYILDKNIFKFLKELDDNNNRDWFNANKADFKLMEANIKQAADYLGKLMSQHDSIDKIKLFRIYRDVRFSKNKLPYKTHFGITFHRLKPQLRGGYYLHLKPNNESFIATGFWQPNKEDLFRIRKELEIDDSDFRAIIKKDSFKSIWGSVVGEEVKTAPKGFNKNHHAIDLIKKKQYIFIKKYTDKDVLSSNFLDDVNSNFKSIRPFFDYMSYVLTTNLNGESLIK